MSKILSSQNALALLEHAASITIAIDKDHRWQSRICKRVTFKDPETKEVLTDEMEGHTIDRDSPVFKARVEAFRNQLQASANAQAGKKDFPKLYFSREIRLWPFIVNLDGEV